MYCHVTTKRCNTAKHESYLPESEAYSNARFTGMVMKSRRKQEFGMKIVPFFTTVVAVLSIASLHLINYLLNLNVMRTLIQAIYYISDPNSKNRFY